MPRCCQHLNARSLDKTHHTRAVYTRRALASTQLLGDSLFGARVVGVEQLTTNAQWVTGLGVIIVSAIAGLSLLVSLLRTYQDAARLPAAKCAAPGRVSFGSYATLVSFVTFCAWLLAVAIALTIAGQLAWLLLAFVFEAALARGVQ